MWPLFLIECLSHAMSKRWLSEELPDYRTEGVGNLSAGV